MWEQAKLNITEHSKKDNIFVAHSDAMEFLKMLQQDGEWKSEAFDFIFIDLPLCIKGQISNLYLFLTCVITSGAFFVFIPAF